MAKQMDHPLRDRIVLITDAGRAVGRVFAEHLAYSGARIVLVVRSADELEEMVGVIEAGGGEASCFVVDVTDAAAVEDLISRVERKKGPIDVLINNAGTRGPKANAWECDWHEWWRAIEVNLGGAAAFCHAVIPRMVKRRRGRVVNMVSDAGVYSSPTVSAYSVSTAALIKFSENLALECQDFLLSVFAYHPGRLPFEPGSEAFQEESARQLASLLSGAYDSLTGRYITAYDDLDLLVARVGRPVATNDYRRLRASA